LALVVIESSAQKTSNTGDIPTPKEAAASGRPTGTALTRVARAAGAGLELRMAFEVEWFVGRDEVRKGLRSRRPGEA